MNDKNFKNKFSVSIMPVLLLTLCSIYFFTIQLLTGMFIINTDFSSKSIIALRITKSGLYALLFCVFINFLYKYIKHNIEFNIQTSQPHSIKPLIFFIFPTIFSLIILGFVYFCIFPGGFSPDSHNQLLQATNGNYSNWHPYLHTIIFFTIPIKITSSASSIVLFQIILFSIALAYSTYTIYNYGAPIWFCIIVPIFVLLNPFTINILTHPWKDCGMAIFSLILISFYIDILKSRGSCFENKIKIILFSIFFVLCSAMRHNAILYTIPLLIGSLFYIRNKVIRLKVITISLSLLILINFAIPKFFNIEKPNQRVTESTGLCMAIMGNVVKNSPEDLDADTLNFLYDVTSKEMWDKYYSEPGQWNNVKVLGHCNIQRIEDEGILKILKNTLKTIKASPGLSFQAICRLTGVVWQIDGDISESFFDSLCMFRTITLSGVKEYFPNFIRSLEDVRLSFTDALVFYSKDSFNWISKYFYSYIGIYQLILIVCSVLKCFLNGTFKPLIHIMPFTTYNFITAMLLSGFDWRFFFCSTVVFLPTLYILVSLDIDSVKLS